MGNPYQCANQIRQYGIQKIDQKTLDSVNQQAKITRNMNKRQKAADEKLKKINKTHREIMGN